MLQRKTAPIGLAQLTGSTYWLNLIDRLMTIRPTSPKETAWPVARPVTPHGILVEQLERLQSAAETESVTAQFKADLSQTTRLAAGLDPYLEACTTAESPALAQLAKATQQEDWSKHFDSGATVKELEQEMLSGHIEGQFLKMLVAISQSKRVLEIGMFTGYSALAIAEALPEDGLLIACEVDAYAAKFAQRCFEASSHGDKIQVKVAPAAETLRELATAGESFDIAFIDADKGGYIDYVNLLLESSLLTPDGFICIDNTLMQGQPYLDKTSRTANGEAITQFNQFLTEDDRIEQVMLPIRDGFTLIKRRSDRPV
ncbi:O-methyltransferase family [Synechococcus sp. PCC 7335]|uniref:O-methyltransferase n=1 Tax=Synechococcus sp. (strain ATCC 29403 / PCC 7335) TaxID=91464 RepID=UPI00017EE474|nr:class I SAM-dependent methyltransferase [Synechococcus sp. PCC 7335]EDX85265.1 O-methyltransferase family [Synechococcus sp. PCC 7335]